MGQLIKKIENIDSKIDNLTTELNGPIYGDENIIHFHYKNIRFEMFLSDYLTLLSGVIIAKESLEKLKQ